MKAYIYGYGKLQQDFEYMFNDIEILGYCDDEKTDGVDSLENVIQNKEQDAVIVICKRDEEHAVTKLKELGLCYKQDFYLASDLFYQLEPMWKNVKGRDIYIWGIGNMGQVLYEKIGALEIKGYIDKKADNEKELCFHEYKVFAPQGKIDPKRNFIIVAITNGGEKEVEAELLCNGYVKGKDYISFNQWGNLQEWMRKVYYAYPLVEVDFRCRHPFEYARLEANGNINICEPNYILTSIGSANAGPFVEIWNGAMAKLYRLSVENRTYALCDGEKCPWLKSKAIDRTDARYEEIGEEEFELRVSANIDPSCNLYCASCRNERYVITEEELRKKEYLIEYMKKQMIPNAKGLYVAECGDIFFSKVYRNILDELEYTNYIGIYTNGVLFDKTSLLRWRSKCNTMSIIVSVDASTEETYSKLRRGGDFQRLMKNLEVVSELRRENVINKFIICFVVQRDNVAEMSAFVQLGKKMKVDLVEFWSISNWGTYTDDEFEDVTVVKAGKIKKEYMNYFCDKGVKEKNVCFYCLPVEEQYGWGYIDKDIRF